MHKCCSIILLVVCLTACGRYDSASGTQQRGTDIANLVANPPPASQVIEITAYAARVGHGPHGGPFGSGPACWPQILTDYPRARVQRILNSTGTGAPVDGTPWLYVHNFGDADLPFYARLRGHMADNSIPIQCTQITSTFVVDAVLEVYQQDIPDYMQVPEVTSGTDSWLRYNDSTYGFSLLYPPDWTIVAAKNEQGLPLISTHAPQFPEHPIQLRVYAGETYQDPHDIANSPPLVRNGWPGQQDFLPFSQQIASQGLWVVTFPTRAVFIGGGYTYELNLDTVNGTPQSVIDTLIAMVVGFRLENVPLTTPTTIRQTIDTSRTYLSENAIVQQVRESYGQNFVPTTLEILPPYLITEQAARNVVSCFFQGHPGAVLVVTMQGKSPLNGHLLTVVVYVDAETGNQLCTSSEEQIPFDSTPTIDPLTATAIEQSKALTPGITPLVTATFPPPEPTWPPNSGPSPVPPTITSSPAAP